MSLIQRKCWKIKSQLINEENVFNRMIWKIFEVEKNCVEKLSVILKRFFIRFIAVLHFS